MDGQYRIEKLDKKKVSILKISPTDYRTSWGTVHADREDENISTTASIVRKSARGAERRRGEREASRRSARSPAAGARRSRSVGRVDFGRGLPTTGQWRNGFEFADMNEDGFLDWFTARRAKEGGDRTSSSATARATGARGRGVLPDQTYDYGDVSVGLQRRPPPGHVSRRAPLGTPGAPG
jgi:hypothetical protein